MKKLQRSIKFIISSLILPILFTTSACNPQESTQIPEDIPPPATPVPPEPTSIESIPTPGPELTSTPICLSTQTASSGDAGKILFSSYRDGESEIYMMDADGSNLVRLTEIDDRAGQPKWSPDGKSFAFVRNMAGSYLEIWGMTVEGGEMMRIPTNFRLIDTEPAWSPDGSQIVFTSNVDSYKDYRGRSVTVFNIFRVNADGSDLVRLTEGTHLDTSPNWSPDGLRIAYQSNRVGNFEIYTLGVDGITPKNLTNRLTNETSPAWSPDGSKIAFVSDRDGNQEIYVMDADGSNQTRLTNHSFEDRSPTWSPDGRWIAFYSNRDGNFEIYKMKADGSGVTRLTNHYNFDGYPSWQPVFEIDLGSPTGATNTGSGRKVADLTDCLDGNLIP